MKTLNLLTVLALAASVLAGCSAPCWKGPCNTKPAIRPIDQACLPAGAPKSNVPLYRGDIQAQYIQIAKINSSACILRTPDQAAVMMADLRAKAASVGADAVVDVKMLNNVRHGMVNNPRTPFPSVMQGETKEYFLRGVAVKFLKKPEHLRPELKAEDFAEKAKAKSESGGMMGIGGMPEIATPKVNTPQIGNQ